MYHRVERDQQNAADLDCVVVAAALGFGLVFVHPFQVHVINVMRVMVAMPTFIKGHLLFKLLYKLLLFIIIII